MNPYLTALIIGLGLSGAICVLAFRKKKVAGLKGTVLSAAFTTVFLCVLELTGVLTEEYFDLLNLTNYWVILFGGAVVVGVICSCTAAQYKHSCKEKAARVNQANHQICSLKEKIHAYETNIKSSEDKEKSILREIKATETDLIFARQLEHFFNAIKSGEELPIRLSVVQPLQTIISDNKLKILREKEYRLEEEAAINECKQEIIAQNQIVVTNS